MTMPLTRDAYETLIEDDIAALPESMPNLEREHIISVLRASVRHEYETVPTLSAAKKEIAEQEKMQRELDRAQRALHAANIEMRSKLEERTTLLREVRKDLELRATIKGDDSVVPLGNTLYARLVDATEPQ